MPQADDERHVVLLDVVARLAADEEVVREPQDVGHTGSGDGVEDDAVLTGARAEPVVLRITAWLERRWGGLGAHVGSPKGDSRSRRAETGDELAASFRVRGHSSPPGTGIQAGAIVQAEL